MSSARLYRPTSRPLYAGTLRFFIACVSIGLRSIIRCEENDGVFILPALFECGDQAAANVVRLEDEVPVGTSTGFSVGETQALLSELIKMGGRDLRIRIVGFEIAVAEIVRVDEDNVGLLFRGKYYGN